MFKLAINSILSRNAKRFLIKRTIKEEDISPILREIRTALLNADVNLKVIKDFLEEVKTTIIDNSCQYNNQSEIETAIFKVIKDKLIKILGETTEELNIKPKSLNRIMMVGMNGSGKTTTTAKLSYFLKNKKQMNVKNVSLDIYRPGAFDQLKKLSSEVGVGFDNVSDSNIMDCVKDNIKKSESESLDVIIFDTAGIIPDQDEQLEELKKIQSQIKPTETIFVLDAMAGQEAINQLKIFHSNLNITSLVISKADSEAPMGAAFSATYLLRIPIKFLGEGEKPENLSQFFVDRIAGRILGEGDLLTLAEKITNSIDAESSKNSFQKIMKGNFDLDDLMQQIKQIKKLDLMKSVFKFLPKQLTPQTTLSNAEEQFSRWEIIISSMTKKEKKNPKLFKKQPNRKIRVVKGSGTKPDELNKLLKKWDEGRKKLEEMKKKMMKGINPFSMF